MVPFERALVSFYRPSIVTFPLSLLPLLFSSMPLFPYPTASLPKISLCSAGSRWIARCWANCPCNYFPRFPTYVITNHQRYGQTDRQTTCDPKTAPLHKSALRGKNVTNSKRYARGNDCRDVVHASQLPLNLCIVSKTNKNIFIRSAANFLQSAIPWILKNKKPSCLLGYGRPYCP